MPETEALSRKLRDARDQELAWAAEADDLIWRLHCAGATERQIAKAARLTGPAIHYRITRKRAGAGV